jgi:hypothetical protein
MKSFLSEEYWSGKAPFFRLEKTTSLLWRKQAKKQRMQYLPLTRSGVSDLNLLLSEGHGQTAQHRLPLTFLFLFLSRKKEKKKQYVDQFYMNCHYYAN